MSATYANSTWTIEDGPWDYNNVPTYILRNTVNTAVTVNITTANHLVEGDCDIGYTLTNNVCNLIDAALVEKPSDDVCEVSIKVGVFVKSPKDPDCSNTNIRGLGTNQLEAVTPAKSVYLVTSATGEVTVYEKKFNAETNSTVTNIGNFSSSGDVNYLQTVNSLGNTVAVNPLGGTGSGGTGTGSAEGSALDASLNVKAGGDESVAGSNAIAGGTSETFSNVDSVFSSLRSFSVPVVHGTCATATFEVFNKTYSFSAMCNLFESNSLAIQNAMTLVYIISALFIVLGA
jgi:hypothetical protein